jgi:putative transposon-encoded protein
MEKTRIESDCYQVLDKEVKRQKNSGCIYVPKAWIGRKTRVLLIEPIEE